MVVDEGRYKDMKRSVIKWFTVLSIAAFLGVTVLELNALARAGGGGSSGSRGSRSLSAPSRSPSQPSPSRQQAAPVPQQPSPQPGGGFLRGLGGGILGGLLGGMLFSSLGFGGVGGGLGGSGIGLFEIILVAGIGFFIYKMVRRKRQEQMYYQQSTASAGGYAAGPIPGASLDEGGLGPATDSVDQGLAYIRQMDSTFDVGRFNDTATDIFFRIQGAWMNRDLSSVAGSLTEEMRGIFQKDIDTFLREKKVNRLDSIAVRQVEPVEAWQESGNDFITIRFYANLLDYTTDETTGVVTAGSKTEPVKFEEYWTFTRPVGNNPWRLSAIAQA
jgi:predicted lipid-binding transport protein (Tim44 family)